MRVGDLVQQGTRVMEIRNSGELQRPSRMIGTVVALHDLPPEMKASRNGDWSKLLGTKTVDVLWSNGRLMENYAENSLEVIEGK